MWAGLCTVCGKHHILIDREVTLIVDTFAVASCEFCGGDVIAEEIELPVSIFEDELLLN